MATIYECARCGIMPGDLPDGFGIQDEPEMFFEMVGGKYYCFACVEEADADQAEYDNYLHEMEDEYDAQQY